MRLWSRIFVPRLVNCACSSRAFNRYRKYTASNAFGHVLEIGCGGGLNFALYDTNSVTKLTALEPDPVMMSAAQKQAAKHSDLNIDFLAIGAERLPLDDNIIDSVVVTFVLCTIPDWQAALSELKRVLKPGGVILFCEHGRSPDAAIAKWQTRLEPLWKTIAGGCHLTRSAADMLTKAGFQITQIDEDYARMAPKFAGFISQGQAIKAVEI